MKHWMSIVTKFCSPPRWVTVLLTLAGTGALVTVFVMGWEQTPVAYAVYVLAFYALTVVTVACVRFLPGWVQGVKQAIFRNQYGNRYLTDAAFKTHVSLYRSLTVNLLYVAVNVGSYFLYRSAWFAILAGYYTILAVMRFLLLRYVGRVGIGTDFIREYRRSRLCGIILMTVNLNLSCAVLMILYQNRGYRYHGVLIYVMAAYTFYITAHAIIDMVKSRRYQSPVLSSAKSISLCAALVSMLSLETAMLSQFGGDTPAQTKWLLVVLTGAGVSVTVLTLSVHMILRANKRIALLKEEANGRS